MASPVSNAGSLSASVSVALAQRQAARAAQQAEARADALQAESARARNEAQRANARANELQAAAQGADADAGRLRSNAKASESFERLSNQFSASRLTGAEADSKPSETDTGAAAAVVNDTAVTAPATATQNPVATRLQAFVASSYANNETPSITPPATVDAQA